MKHAGFYFGPAVLALVAVSACGSDERVWPPGSVHGGKPSPECGNGVREAGEACDDGNNENDDGCSRTCTVLNLCLLPPDPGKSRCKRGAHTYFVYDAADNSCKELLFTGCGGNDNRFLSRNQCETACMTACGNGRVERGEDCDDGNDGSGDGCSAECRSEGSVVIDGGVTKNRCPRLSAYSVAPLQVAVGGTIALNASAVDAEGDPWQLSWTASAGEILLGTDPTTARYRCTVEGRHTLTLRLSDGSDGNADCDTTRQIEVTCTSIPVCGDSIADPREQCEDGNVVGGDGCSATCTLEAPR